VTEQNLTIATATSGTLAITGAAALNITGVATTLTTTGAVAWNASGGAFGVNVTEQALTIRTITSGTLAITSAGALNLTGTSIASLSRMTTTDGVTSGTAKVVGGRAYSKVADTTSTSTTDEEALGSYTIPADTLKANSVLRVRFGIFVTNANSTDTLTVRLRLGPTTLTGTAIFTGTATDATANDIMYGDFTLIARAAPGASAACSAYGIANLVEAATGAAAPLIHRMAPTNFATNGDLLLEVTSDWSVAHGNNDATCEFMEVEIL